jgi:hypothetical protein
VAITRATSAMADTVTVLPAMEVNATEVNAMEGSAMPVGSGSG